MGKSGLAFEDSAANGEDTPPIAVIIPTYNRVSALTVCLEHLERQTWQDFEVVVVDDGSTDETPQFLERYLTETPLRVRSLRQSNAGPARARNLAISRVAAAITLMIGDDIFCSPGLVAEHLRFHRTHTGVAEAGVGLTEWSTAGQSVTPFMRWLDESGTQFSYGDLLAGVPPDWKHFYTSNLSLKTEMLRQNPFHEGFKSAAMEDIELGYRLERRRGLTMTFLPRAAAAHLHPTNFLQAARRLEGIGRSSFLFHQLWPEHRLVRRRSWPRRLADPLLRTRWFPAALTRMTASVTEVWCPNPLIAPVLGLHNAEGYRRAEEEALRRGAKPSGG